MHPTPHKLYVFRAPTFVAALLVIALGCDDGASVPDAGGQDATGLDSGDATGEPDGGSTFRPPEALAALTDTDALRDRSTLRINIDSDRSGRVPGDFDEPIWQLGFSFYSQSFLGADWTHTAVLVLPDDLSRANGAAGIVQWGTPNPLDGISDSVNFLPQYAAITADRLDLPILLISGVPPVVDLRSVSELAEYETQFPDCFGGPLADADLFWRCLWDISQASDQPEIFPTLPIAVSYVRAVTALQELADLVPTLTLPFDPPVFSVDGVAVLASDVGGFALRHAMALDERIAGVMAAGADLGDLPAFFDLQQRNWLTDFTLGDPTVRLGYLDSFAGAEFLEAYGLAHIGGSLHGRTYWMAVGTNDPRMPLDALSLYEPLLPTDRGLLYVAGGVGGMGTEDHVRAWRVMLAHTFRNRPIANLSVSFEEEGGNVTVSAQLTGETLVQTVDLFYVQRHGQIDDTDYRDAIWQRSSMVEDETGLFQAAFPKTAQNSAFFVRVVDSQNIYEGPLTSNVTIVGP